MRANQQETEPRVKPVEMKGGERPPPLESPSVALPRLGAFGSALCSTQSRAVCGRSLLPPAGRGWTRGLVAPHSRHCEPKAWQSMACPRPIPRPRSMDCRGPCGPRNDAVREVARAAFFSSSREPEDSGAADQVGGDEGGTDAAPSPPRVFCFRPQAPGAGRPARLATRHKARRPVGLAALRAGSSPHAALVAPRPPLAPPVNGRGIGGVDRPSRLREGSEEAKLSEGHLGLRSRP